MPIIATNTPIDIAKTYDAAKTITAISKNSTGGVTSSAHGYANGDIVVLAVQGMSELDGQVARVANSTTNAFDLEGIDTTSYGTFSSGSVQRISAWDRVSNAQSISASQAQPNRIDVTTLLDTQKQYVFGLADSPQITLSGLLDPLGVATANIRAASRTNTAKVLRVNFNNGMKLYTNAFWSGGDGFEGNGGDVLKQTTTLTQIKNSLWFAS